MPNWRAACASCAITAHAPSTCTLTSAGAHGWTPSRQPCWVSSSVTWMTGMAPEARGQSVHHIYAVRVPDGRRDRVRERMVAAGVGASVHYPTAVHRQEAFAALGYGEVDMPVAERASGELLSLPLYAEITEAQQQYVVDELLDALERS